MLGDLLQRVIDLGIGDVGDDLFDLEGAEIGKRDRRHDFDGHGIAQVRLAVEHALDLGLLGRQRHLRLGGELEAAFGENLGIGVAHRLLDSLGHHRLAVDLLEVTDRHLAGAEAVDLDAVLHVGEALIDLGVEVGSRNDDLELVLQSLGEGFGDLHGVFLLFCRRGGWIAPSH